MTNSSSRRQRSPGASAGIEPPADLWYFAYGSNLSKHRMEQRTGAVRNAQAACLRDYRLAFNNAVGEAVYANIVPFAGSLVWGAVYLCDRQALMELDRYEGVAQGCYRRVVVAVETRNGKRLDAETYLADDKRTSPQGRPSAIYLDLIVTGAREHGLSDEYIGCLEALGRQHGP